MPPRCEGKFSLKNSSDPNSPIGKQRADKTSLLVAILLESEMFTLKEVVDGFKSVDLAGSAPEAGHCRNLIAKARALGFRDYHDFLMHLKCMPQEEFASVSLKLMREICAMRLPSDNTLPYFELLPLPSGMGYYSQWIGWDKYGEEVRVPRPLAARNSVSNLRGLGRYPVYVIESERELIAWRSIWRSRAYVRAELAMEEFPAMFGKGHLVAKNVPTSLIRAAAARNSFADNIAVG